MTDSTLALVLVVIGLWQLDRWFTQRAWARERKDLYNRLQAGTLSDYALRQPQLEKATPKKQSVPTATELDPTVVVDRITPEAMARANEAARKLVGD